MTFDELVMPFGPVAFATEGDALVSLEFGPADEAYEARLRQIAPGTDLRRGKPAVTDRLRAYVGGDLTALDAVQVAPHRGTAFQRAVWAALRTIPVGQTWSYGQLAQRIGRPSAVRAVGLANGRNPIAIVVPCHRVIGADGSLTGFGGGLPTKRWLLVHERALLA